MFAGFPDDQIKVCASNVILGSIEVLPHNNARIPDTSATALPPSACSKSHIVDCGPAPILKQVCK